jgi:hypothetical protein
MSHLVELQRDFQRRLLDADKDAPSWISRGGRATPATQLSVYTNAYRARLKEVLQHDFPVLAAALGGERFDTLADAYIETHPSHAFTLRDFGRDLATFLREHAEYGDTPILHELAAFEWTLGEAFDAADDRALTEQDVTSVPAEAWPVLQFVFHASVRRLDLATNTPSLWKAVNTETTPPEAHTEPEPRPWLIWRQELTTRYRSLTEEEALALDAAKNGATFSDICEALSSVIPEEQVPLRAASLLKGWIADGLISAVMVAGAPL